MRHLIRKIIVQCLMIFALVTAGISPACAFISGQMTMIEICGADGLMKVAVPADEVPASGEQHQQKHDCGFCIAQTGGKALTTPDAAIIDFSFVYDEHYIFAITSFAVDVLDGRLPVRGPPDFL